MHQSVRRIPIYIYDWYNKDEKYKYVNEIEAFSIQSYEEIRQRQWKKLVRILDVASKSSEYYQNQFKRYNIDVNSIKHPENLLNIPYLTKNDIRRNMVKMRNNDTIMTDIIETATGGTTESPIKIYLDRYCYTMRRAATLYFQRWYGSLPGSPTALLWGAEQDYTKRISVKDKIKQVLFGRVIYLPSSYLNEEVMWNYYYSLMSFKADVLQAYPTPLYIFSEFLEKNNLKLKIRNINVAAEYLYPYQREKIESVFGVKIFNWYGARELGHIATECKYHNGMHINCHGVYIEVIKNGKQVVDEMGEFVVTDLLNTAMPLIRYKIGDIGKISNRICPCGSGLPLIEEVGGRYADTFKKRDGSYIPGVALTNRVIKDHHGIEKLQIIQRDYELYKLNIVKGSDYSEDAVERLKNNICDFIHERIEFEVNFVDDILPEKSGKILFCKSEIH